MSHYGRMKTTTAEREEAVAALRNALKPGDTLFTILRHCSRSGMQRTISIIKISKNGQPGQWSWSAAKACGWNYDNEREGIKVGGCGMDMGFHLVYSLGRVLFPDGFKVKGIGRNGDTSGRDTDGGYALNHRWL